MNKNQKVVLIFIIIGTWIALMLSYGVFLGLNCLDVKEEYENDSSSAKEKYGFSNFEEWAGKNKMFLSCIPKQQSNMILILSE